LPKFISLKSPRPSLIPAVCWLCLSVFLLTIPGSKIPKQDWLDKIWFDKWVHIGLFGILTWLWCRGLPARTRTTFILVGIACLVYGVVMEFVQQYLVANRSFDGGDIIADAAGCLLGAGVSMKWYIKK